MSIRAVVIGGTNGIGYGMACRAAASALAEHATSPSPSSSTPPRVIISGRINPPHLPHPNMTFLPLDATSMRSIKSYTDTLLTTLSLPSQTKIPLLIMSQGVMNTSGRTEPHAPAERIDRKMALHYYGKQLLIRELLPVLAEDARVVIVYDGVWGRPGALDWDDLDLRRDGGKGYTLGRAANHCMVMTDAMVQYWGRGEKERGEGTEEGEMKGKKRRHFVHAWPGAVYTGLARELPWYLRGPMNAVGAVVGVSPDRCAERLIGGVVECAEGGEREGRYWSNINHKGRLIADKLVWGDEEMDRIATHTWDIVDEALGA